MTEKAENKTRLDALAELRKPFLPEQISQKPQPTIGYDQYKKLPKGECKVCGGYHATSKTVHLAYVGHAAVTNRLLEVDPVWNWEPVHTDENGMPKFDQFGGMWIKLTICGVTRLGYGDAQGKTGVNAIKEVIGDAIRNAAMRFGVALDLWCKGELNPVVEDEEKQADKTAQKPADNAPGEPDPVRIKPYIDALAYFKEGEFPPDALDKYWEEHCQDRLDGESEATRKAVEGAYDNKLAALMGKWDERTRN